MNTDLSDYVKQLFKELEEVEEKLELYEIGIPEKIESDLGISREQVGLGLDFDTLLQKRQELRDELISLESKYSIEILKID